MCVAYEVSVFYDRIILLWALYSCKWLRFTVDNFLGSNLDVFIILASTLIFIPLPIIEMNHNHNS